MQYNLFYEGEEFGPFASYAAAEAEAIIMEGEETSIRSPEWHIMNSEELFASGYN